MWRGAQDNDRGLKLSSSTRKKRDKKQKLPLLDAYLDERYTVTVTPTGDVKVCASISACEISNGIAGRSARSLVRTDAKGFVGRSCDKAAM